MKAEELRKGNLVYSIGNKQKIVNSIFETGIYDKNLNVLTYNSICGIPLTEEWFFKLGYKTYPHGDALFLPGHLVWICDDLFICDKNGIVLKSVHQLQNLYYALTQTELTIK